MEKDSQIKNLEESLNELTKEYTDCQGDINSRIFTARRRGINDSILQIKFLQSEVLSCKNLLAERLKDYELQNEELTNINNVTAHMNKEAHEIYQNVIKAKE